ncbi:MAG: beta-ketoacyl-ACP synthase III [Bacteroidales bacterium]
MPVYINHTSSFLPNKPVPNESMETMLGLVDDRPSRSRRIVLRQNGIKQRYYALTPGGTITHTNAGMTAKAIEQLEGPEARLSQLEVLVCGTSIPDQVLPSHASMVHGELGGHPLEIFSPSGVCCAGFHALKQAYLSIAAGNSSNAVCTGSELISPLMRNTSFDAETQHLKKLEKQPILAFEKDFLRWMLSDGAGAFWLADKPAQSGVSFEINWIDSVSYANEQATCMYCGATKQPDNSLKGWKEFAPLEWLEQSIFAVKQDVKQLGRNIVSYGVKTLASVCKKHNLQLEQVDYLLPHLSSMYFAERIEQEMKEQNQWIPREKWFTNLPEVGNVGSASMYIMLDELRKRNTLKTGEKILLMVPESGRFSYGFALITVC